MPTVDGKREYRLRLGLSAALALVAHVALLALIARYVLQQHEPALGVARRDEPVVLDLHPPERPRRLVDTVTPAEAPTDPNTDLISDQASRASDMGGVESGLNAPAVDRISEFEDIGGARSAPTPPAPEPRPTDRERPGPVEKQHAEQVRRRQAALREPDTLLPEVDESVASAPPPAAAPVTPPSPPLPETDRPGETRGRIKGGVQTRGFAGFEAYRSELAPYLREVRSKVEAQWKGALQLRYSGAAATEAVLLCAIAPDGSLAGVEVLDPGDSPTYASLCKLAVEKAAPFGAFPFEVPEMYRSQNLEIRWTFSYLM